jgi:prepilin-type N-terminal cleavage/methylation domain-containing protein
MVLGPDFQRRNQGFTFIELVVVIGIIAILIGLLAAWFLKIHAAADQAKSIDNLRELASASINCNQQWKKLPAGVGYFPRAGRPSGTLFQLLLPHLKENTAIFVAPGDPSLPADNLLKNGLGACSYAGNGYVFSGDDGLTWQDIAPDTPPNCNNFPTAMIPTTFLDGTANTVLFMEKYARCNLVENPRQGYEEDGPGEHGWADNTLLGKKIGTNGYYSNFTPIQISLASPQFQPHLLDADCKLPQGFSHSSIGVSMADGSTRSISFRVSLKTWGLLLLPNDEQRIPGDWK